MLVNTRYGQRESARLVLGTEGGKRLQLAIPTAAEHDQRALQVVRTLAPAATIGFSPEVEARFDRDPRSLRTA